MTRHPPRGKLKTTSSRIRSCEKAVFTLYCPQINADEHRYAGTTESSATPSRPLRLSAFICLHLWTNRNKTGLTGIVSSTSCRIGPHPFHAGWHSLHRLCCETTRSPCVHVQFSENLGSQSKAFHSGFLCLRHTPTSWKCHPAVALDCARRPFLAVSSP